MREIIKENGGTIFEDEDLHTEALSKEKEEKVETKEEVPTENLEETIIKENSDKPNSNN